MSNDDAQRYLWLVVCGGRAGGLRVDPVSDAGGLRDRDAAGDSNSAAGG